MASQFKQFDLLFMRKATQDWEIKKANKITGVTKPIVLIKYYEIEFSAVSDNNTLHIIPQDFLKASC